MIVDLDAHQGNGHERDKLASKDKQIYIIDFYNPWIFPRDNYAKEAIDQEFLLSKKVTDEEYLTQLQEHLNMGFQKFQPQFVIYNAGTDILKGDRLGECSISKEGVIKRDETVFAHCMKEKVPLLMLLSGGYQKINAQVIAESLININRIYSIME